MENGKELDYHQGRIMINPDGGLYANGTRRVETKRDDETGFRTFETIVPGKSGQKEERYVHVEVFRHFTTLSLGRLAAEDVEFVRADLPNPFVISNLQLSEIGMAKVYPGPEGEAPTPSTSSGTDSGTPPEGGQETPTPSAPSTSSGTGSGTAGTGSETSPEGEQEPPSPTLEGVVPPPGEDISDVEEEEQELLEIPEPMEFVGDQGPDEVEQPHFLAVRDNDSHWYDIVDPETKQSVLETLTGSDKRINGKKRVNALAADKELDIRFE